MSTTLAGLKSEIRQYIHRSAAHTANYEDIIIGVGEKWIFRHARTREMEAALNVTLAGGVAAIPADYVELKHAYIEGTPARPLTRMQAAQLIAKYPTRSADSKPYHIADDAGSFIFGPFPDSNYVLKGTYFKRLTSLISAVNDLFTNNYDLYLYAALAEAGLVLKHEDSRVAKWEAKRNQLLLDVNGEATRQKSSGGALVMSLG